MTVHSHSAGTGANPEVTAPTWSHFSFPMKSTLLRLLPFLTLFVTALHAAAPANPAFQAALRAADDERVAAILSGNPARLDAIFSEDLSYTHSNGDFDNKATYLKKLVTGSTKYSLYQYNDRSFTALAPGLAMMNARIMIKGQSEASPQLDIYLSVLAIFREEQGKWRFLAWQSARLPAPAAK